MKFSQLSCSEEQSKPLAFDEIQSKSDETKGLEERLFADEISGSAFGGREWLGREHGRTTLSTARTMGFRN
jgi:hypothetical protein